MLCYTRDKKQETRNKKQETRNKNRAEGELGEAKQETRNKRLNMEQRKNDLSERLFEFAVRIIEFLKTLPYTPENRVIRTQLAKSATSSGANYEESQGGSSKLEFTNKIRIATREMRESNYWLRIIKRTVPDINRTELDYLIKESVELKKILGTIVQKCN